MHVWISNLQACKPRSYADLKLRASKEEKFCQNIFSPQLPSFQPPSDSCLYAFPPKNQKLLTFRNVFIFHLIKVFHQAQQSCPKSQRTDFKLQQNYIFSPYLISVVFYPHTIFMAGVFYA